MKITSIIGESLEIVSLDSNPNRKRIFFRPIEIELELIF